MKHVYMKEIYYDFIKYCNYILRDKRVNNDLISIYCENNSSYRCRLGLAYLVSKYNNSNGDKVCIPLDNAKDPNIVLFLESASGELMRNKMLQNETFKSILKYITQLDVRNPESIESGLSIYCKSMLNLNDNEIDNYLAALCKMILDSSCNDVEFVVAINKIGGSL